MSRTVKLSHLEETLAPLDYPLSRSEASSALDDVTLELADGEWNLGDVVDDVGSESFESPEDLMTEVYQYLPVEAVGEPGQSEGDA